MGSFKGIVEIIKPVWCLGEGLKVGKGGDQSGWGGTGLGK